MDVSLEPAIKTYKINFTKGHSEIIHAFKLAKHEFPDDDSLRVLACKVTGKMKITKKFPDNKENYKIPKAIWDHLEPNI